MLGENDGTAWIEVNLTGKRPRVKAELLSEKMDLRPMLVKAGIKDDGGARSVKSKTQKNRVFSKQPWNLDTLQVIDAELKVRNKNILLRNLAFTDLMADIVLENGELTIKPIKFEVGGGQAQGQFSFASQGKIPLVDGYLTIDRLDLGMMLDQLGYKRALEGNLDVDVTLSGSGDSTAALMAGLDGDIYLSMKDGKTDSKYLELLQKYLGTDVVRLLNPFKSKKPYTEINCSFNSINIRDGLANIKLLLDTKQTTIVGAGEIELKTEKLDLGVQPKPKSGYGHSSVGTVSFSLSELSRPFRLGGTLAKPSLQLDVKRTAVTLGKFAGALALGPAGLAVLFSDVSLGKKSACLQAAETFEKKKEAAKTKNPENNN
jgi:uncharacterized protein involved in outer membrane biogenesis